MPNTNRWPIARWALALLIGIQVLTVGLMLVLGHFLAERSYADHVRGLMSVKTLASLNSLERLLDPAERIINKTQSLIKHNVLSNESRPKLLRYFYETINEYPDYSSIFIGDSSKQFLFVTHSPDKDYGPYMSKVMSKSDPGVASKIYYDDQFRELASRRVKDNYDPTSREWFKASDTDKPRWNGPYIFYTDGKPGITVSVPLHHPVGPEKCVLGLDIKIPDLANFLLPAEQSPNTSVMVLAGDDVVVAHTDLDTVAADPEFADKSGLIKVAQLEDVNSHLALQALSKPAPEQVSHNDTSLQRLQASFTGEDGNTYLAEQHSYTKYGIRWTVVVFSPESDFIGEIRGGQRLLLGSAIASSLLVTVLAFLLTMRLLRPVNELQESVLRDPLTGLYNRRGLVGLGGVMVKEAQLQKSAVSVAMIDIDHFKAINDKHGHDVGDEVLRIVARRMQRVLKEGDLLARSGGEEFSLLIFDAPLVLAVPVCERVRKSVCDRTFSTSVGEIAVTVSIGVAGLKRAGNSISAATKRADRALYLAKEQGRNRVCTEQNLPVRQRALNVG